MKAFLGAFTITVLFVGLIAWITFWVEKIVEWHWPFFLCIGMGIGIPMLLISWAIIAVSEKERSK